MQTTVESMMISQAEESVSKFFAWANKKFVEVKQVCPLQGIQGICAMLTRLSSA